MKTVVRKKSRDDRAEGSSPALIVFLRNPNYEQVKTRLAATIGAEAAREIYRQLVTCTLRLVEAAQLPTYLYYASKPDSDSPLAHIPHVHYRTQSGSDLGARMYTALESVLSQHDCALLIGTDCPYLELSHLMEALDALACHDVVVGPAADGGYYLIGMTAPHGDLFEQIAWSTPAVLTQTRQQAQAARLSLHLLPILQDIDTAEDWYNYLQHADAERKPSPRPL